MTTTETVPAEADLWFPEPQAGEEWNTHTIHTHYFGFSIPNEKIGAFIYLRVQPYFKLCFGGVAIHQGMNNLHALDCEHINLINTLPPPKVSGNVIEIANGLKFDFKKPGSEVHLTYKSKDGNTSFDLLQTAICQAIPRGHVMPGEDVDTDPAQRPGGLEQMMHCVGELVLNGTKHKVDCFAARDRSWRQVRTEDEVPYPPVGWSPIAFGPDFCFNQVGYEDLSTSPDWTSCFDVDEKKASHYFGFLIRDAGEVRKLVRVTRKVTKFHPQLWAAIEQEMEVEDDKGETYHLQGRAISMAHLPTWPNNMFVDAVYEWKDGHGRTAYCVYQEAWYHRYWQFRQGKLERS